MDAAPLHALTAAMTAWTGAEDPLLGAMPDVALDDAAAILASSDRAGGVARVLRTPTLESRSLWIASTADVLQLRLAAEATADDVAAVLDAWLDREPAVVEEDGGEHAWSLRLPVVARQATVPLLDRRFAPTTSTMVRRVRPTDGDDVASRAGDVRIRPVADGDAPALVALMRELVATETAFGATRTRAVGIGDHHADDAIRRGGDWSVVAEVAGDVVGWMSLSPFEDSTWAAPSTSASPTAYLGTASIARASRSRGIGRLLASAIHLRAAEAGADATLLDASVSNPWSMPFWHRVGYRPLFTTWQRRLRRRASLADRRPTARRGSCSTTWPCLRSLTADRQLVLRAP